MDHKKATPNAKSQVMYDPMIIPRVKQYLEENVHQTYVDVGVMARQLQERYREYSRRKAQPFRQLVEQAYKTVLHSYGLDSNPSSDDNDDISSDLEMMEQQRPDIMNNMMTNMYMDKQGSRSEPSSNELIDISSDESDTDPGNGKRSSKTKEVPLIAPKPPSITIVKVAQPADGNNVAGPAKDTGGLPIKPGNKNLEALAVSNVLASFSPMAKRRKMQDDALVQQVQDGKIKSEVTIQKQKLPQHQYLQSSNGTATNGAATQSTSKGLKKSKKEFIVQNSVLEFKDIGGLDKVLKELCELLLHIKHPEVYRFIGLPPPRGFLLHGPPGCGKTLLAQAIAGQLDVGLIQVAATELVAGVSGESEERIRELFEQAASVAPCVLFIDEIDAISSNRQNAQKDMERRIVAQLLSSLDGLSKYPHGDQVVIIGATNRPDSLDPALRRVGRFDQEISLGIPDRSARESILKVVCKSLVLQRPFNYDSVAALTPGYVGADLLALATRAASLAVKRAFTAREQKAIVRNIPIATVDLIDDSCIGADEPQSVAQPSMDVDAVLPNSSALPEPTLQSQEVDVAVNGDSETTKKVDEAKETETVAEKPVDTAIDIEQGTETTKEIPQATEIESLETQVQSVSIEINTDVEMKPVEEANPEPTKEATTQPDEKETSQTANVEPAQSATPIVAISEVVDLSDDDADDTIAKVTSVQQLPLHNMLRWLSDSESVFTNEDLRHLCITMKDFTDAVKLVQPSAKREGFITVPDVTWDDIGSMRDIREELQLAVLAPVKYPQKLLSLGLHSPSGVLLCGPPGCGKTLLAKAVANEAGINFISVKGPELLNMYVGESERAVRQCFQRARNSAPCVIFFDEFDSLCPTRSGSSENTSSSRVVNQLLTEMDGVEDRKGVFLMAATNRPDIVDPAVLRPGRLDKILYVGLPGVKDRKEILEAITKKKPKLASDVTVEELATLTENYTGADLAGLVRQASLHALKDSIAASLLVDASADASSSSQTADHALCVSRDNFVKALAHIRPSVSEEDKRHYAKLQKKYMVTASTPQ